MISTVGVQLSFSYVSSEHLEVAAWEVLGSDSEKGEEENHLPLSYVSYRSIRHRLRFPSLQEARGILQERQDNGRREKEEEKNKEKDTSKEQEQEMKSSSVVLLRSRKKGGGRGALPSPERRMTGPAMATERDC